MQTCATEQALPRAAPARVLACGAYLKNRVCLVDGERVLWSPEHGDLGVAQHCMAMERSVDGLLAMASGPVQAVAHDLHPDFHSTRVAQALAAQLGVPALGIQHHHAHIGVVLAEQALGQPVIALALDGMGLGDDGQAWGAEVLWVGASASAHQWQRLDHLHPLALPGGDAAARAPWRMAAAALHAMGRGNEIVPRFAPVVGLLAAQGVQLLLQRDLRCPRTSSAGRWFDAAAGALGLCVHQAFEAEAAMALQAQAQAWLAEHPQFDWPYVTLHSSLDASLDSSLDLRPVLAQLFALADGGAQAIGRGAALFHLALANGLAHQARACAQDHGTRHVVLAGGCFANTLLTERLDAALRGYGLDVWLPQSAGCGDAGLALGQAWIAACAVQAGSRALRSHAPPARATGT